MTDNWDVIVIGAGPVGENAAQYAIQGSGRTAALIEAELVGGECSYWACMPSKALLNPGEVLDRARHVPGVAELVGERELAVGPVLARRDRVVSDLDDAGQVAWATGAGIEVIRGRGELIGEKRVRVTSSAGTRELVARHAVVLATGTTASIPDVPGLAAALPWTSRDATNLHEVPRRMVIIGGGVVAAEAATWLLSLGVAELTILGSAPELLGRMEPFAGQSVREQLSERGGTVRVGATVVAVDRQQPSDTGVGQVHGGPVTVTYRADGEQHTVTADEVLVAAGRRPASSDLGLDHLGVPVDRGFVTVDEHLTVPGLPWLYAVGDVNGKALLTHMGKYQARIAGAVIAARAEGREPAGPWFSDAPAAVPQVTFTDPQVGSVGQTLDAALSAGLDAVAVDQDLAALAGTYVARENYRGRARIVVDRAAGMIVGATFVGPEIAELVHAATVAVVGRVPLTTLWHAVPSYPTVSEVWLRLLESVFNPSS